MAVDGGGQGGGEAGGGGRRAEGLLRRRRALLTAVREGSPGVLAGAQDQICKASGGEGVEAAGDPLLEGRQRRPGRRGLASEVLPRGDVQQDFFGAFGGTEVSAETRAREALLSVTSKQLLEALKVVVEGLAGEEVRRMERRVLVEERVVVEVIHVG